MQHRQRSSLDQSMLHYETLKFADQRNINHFVKPVEIRIVKLSNEITESTANEVNEPKSNEDKIPISVCSTSSNHNRSFRSWAMNNEWSEGLIVSTLSATPRYSNGFPLSEILPIAVQLCSVLNAIHRAPIQRRGLSSNNILYDSSTGRIELLDFGLPSLEALESAKRQRRRQ